MTLPSGFAGWIDGTPGDLTAFAMTISAMRDCPSEEVRVVTKKEIAKAIAIDCGITVLEAQVVIQMLMDAIIGGLLTDRVVELRRFGVFKVKKRVARSGRNPRNGDIVAIRAKRVVTFKSSSELDGRVHPHVGTGDAA